MTTELKGFIELPTGVGKVFFLRVASIDAVWNDGSDTLIQLQGRHRPKDGYSTTLSPEEVIALMAAAQNG